MKHSQLSIILLGIFLFISCADGNNPVDPNSSYQFMGNVGTSRTYIETERWLEVGTNKPLITIPDNYKHNISLIAYQLENGVSIIRNYTENVNPISDDYYYSWKLPLSREKYLQCEALGKNYSLSAELETVKKGNNYSLGNLQVGPDIYQQSTEGVLSIMPMYMQKQSPPLPIIKNDMSVNATWIREKYIDTLTSKIIIETIARVVSKEKVIVSSGVYDAYKIKLTTNHYNPNYSFEAGFEYYVPNVGLVLKESDMVVSQWSSINNQTITFRQIIRKELISYNFISK
jgi:hypothetical protein